MRTQIERKKEQGFTLIEIIAVLVILGILAAVAVPKFMDVQEEAKVKAVKGALASGLSTASMQYARLTLSYGGAATSDFNNAAIATACTNNAPSGDFSFTFGSSTNGILVTATGQGKSATDEWERP